MVIELLAGIVQQLFNFLLPEMLFLIFVEKSSNKFKFRFSDIEDYPGLKPFASTWTVGLVAFVLYLVITPLFEFVLSTPIESFLISLGWLQLILLAISFSCFTLIFIVNYIFEKNHDKNTWILGFSCALSLIIFLLFNIFL